MQVLKFDLRLQEIPLDLTGKDGTEQRYTLRALTGPQRDEFMELIAAKTKNGVLSGAGLTTKLVCLSVVGPDGKNVLPAEVDTWPSNVQFFIAIKIKEISGLDEKAADTAKKDSQESNSAG